MAEMWKPHPKEFLEHMIRTINDEVSDELTSWETNFIDSIDEQLRKRGSLSQKQQEILERIYAEKTK